MSTVADWALLYARAGWRVFPTKPGAKSPVYAGWQKDATTDPALIERYWNVPDRGLAIVAGESFDAWDIEGQHLAAFSGWLYLNGYELPPTAPIALTGRGGVHILTAPTGVDGSRNLYLGSTHIGELKSRGGFIVACPSEVDYDGAVGDYIWDRLPVRDVPEAPAWLLGLLERPATVRKTLPTRLASPDDVVAVLGRLTGSVVTAGEGRRNNYLYWAVRRAVEEGVPVRYAVRAFASAAADAGLEADETAKTIESAVGAESVAA